MSLSIPAIDLNVIFWSALADFIISTAIFLIFKIKKLTLAANIFIVFIIPYLSIMFFLNTKPNPDQAIPVLGNYLVSSMVNLLIFLLSCAISYIIGSVAYAVSGGRTEEPDW